jgi:starch synthase
MALYARRRLRNGAIACVCIIKRLTGRQTLKITLVTSELTPFAKTGGLADAVSGLGKELVKLGNEVTVMMPFYRNIQVLPTGLISPLRTSFSGRQITYSIVEGTHEGMKMVFVDFPQYFQRFGIYGDSAGGYADNDERFVFFTRACLEYYKRKGERPDLFHCNDWPTGLFPLFLRTHYYRDDLSKTAVLFTIHNIAYQGNFAGNRFSLLDIGNEFFTSESLEFYGAVSFLKSGILYSDLLTAVSPAYAQEILTEEFGHRLQGVLRARKDRLFGVLNGIDEQVWNPETDPHLVRNYSLRDLSGKKECRRKLLSDAGWSPEDERPILTMISRLALQKGIDLLEAISSRILNRNALLFVLGAGGRRYEEFLRDLRGKHPDQVHVTIGFHDSFAHELEAGSDMCLMPSRYEPCGLNQMYSLKYGTVPIVRAVGGLDNTVQNWDEENQTGNGFKFAPYTADAFLAAVESAMKTFQEKPVWERIMRNGMRSNFSWRNSALQYMSLYDQAIQLKS